jgi:hypothetical protein
VVLDTKRHLTLETKIDTTIDDLYRLPLAEFTAARNALAKTLTGDEGKRVRALVKPTLVPWALNQLFWKARPTYERLLKSGDALRKAQIAALKGRGGDARRALEAHRKALADAVREATRLAEAEGCRPGADDLARMLEALSLAATHPERPGRLTKVVQPAGFEALAGVPVAPPKADVSVAHPKKQVPVAQPRDKQHLAPAAAEAARGTFAHTPSREAAARREREAAAAKRRDAEERVNAAAAALDRAKGAEAAARDAFERAQKARHTAEAVLAAARQGALE